MYKPKYNLLLKEFPKKDQLVFEFVEFHSKTITFNVLMIEN